MGNVDNEELMMSWKSKVSKDVSSVSENRASLSWLVINQFKMAAFCTYLDLTHQGLINLILSVHI